MWKLTRRAIEVAKIKRMCVVSLPGREKHRKHRNQGSKGANFGGAISKRCRFQETGQGAVQRIDAMTAFKSVLQYWRIGLHHILEELPQWTRCSGPTRLLSIDIVHGGVPAIVRQQYASSTETRASLTSTCRRRNYSIPTTVPIWTSASYRVCS